MDVLWVNLCRLRVLPALRMEQTAFLAGVSRRRKCTQVQRAAPWLQVR